MGKVAALTRQAIQVGRLHKGMTVDTNAISAVLVGKEQEDIGLAGWMQHEDFQVGKTTNVGLIDYTIRSSHFSSKNRECANAHSLFCDFCAFTPGISLARAESTKHGQQTRGYTNESDAHARHFRSMHLLPPSLRSNCL